MQLIYRGNTYNYNSAHARRATQHHEFAYELTYRGNTYRIDPTIATPVSIKPSEYELIYRGSTYWVRRSEQGQLTTIVSSTNLSKHKTLTNHSITQEADGYLF